MITQPKIDKLSFNIKKRDIIVEEKLESITKFLESKKITFHNSPFYFTVHLNPTRLIRPNINPDNQKHNLQMNVELLKEFINELTALTVSIHKLNITNLHIAKDRVMNNPVTSYYTPLLKDQTQYKGRVKAIEVNNGTTPSIHIANESKGMNRGEWLFKIYDKSAQLQSHLDVKYIEPFEPLTKEEIKMLGKGYSQYTGIVNLTKTNLMRCEVELKGNGLLKLPHSSTRLTILDILKWIETNTLIEVLNSTFQDITEKSIFPHKKERTKESELDKFIISDGLTRFDSLFLALNKYPIYKEYTNKVVKANNLLIEEIRNKFL